MGLPPRLGIRCIACLYSCLVSAVQLILMVDSAIECDFRQLSAAQQRAANLLGYTAQVFIARVL